MENFFLKATTNSNDGGKKEGAHFSSAERKELPTQNLILSKIHHPGMKRKPRH